MAAALGNKYALGNDGGRPPKFETPEQLQIAIDEYIAANDQLTITGMALWLGFDSRQSMYDYEKREQFTPIIRLARLHVENSYEKSLRSVNCTGSIFALKNMGWKDRVETEMSGGLGITWKEEKTYEAKPEANEST